MAEKELESIDKIKAEIEQLIENSNHWTGCSYGFASDRIKELKGLLSVVEYLRKKAYEESGDDAPEEQDRDSELRNVVLDFMNQYTGDNYFKAPWFIDSTGFVRPFTFAKLGADWQKEKDKGELQEWGTIRHDLGWRRGIQDALAWKEKQEASAQNGSPGKDVLEAAEYLRKYADRCAQGENSKLYIYDLASRIESLHAREQQEWSKQDEELLNGAIELMSITKAGYNNDEYFQGKCTTIMNWLKNIKYRLQDKAKWKPTPEQIEALEVAEKFYSGTMGFNRDLWNLLDDLKKMM